MTKNIFAVFRFRRVRLVLGAVGIAVSGVGPAALLMVPGARIPAMVAWGSAAGLYGMLSRTNRISAGYSLMLPAAAGMVSFAMLRSMAVAVRRNGVIWRGTFYSLAELRRHADDEFEE
jgi:hypothetical protein